VIECQRDAELASGGVEDANALGHHFFADAVAGDGDDAIGLGHDGSFSGEHSRAGALPQGQL
jgi:hypothetical protein